MFSHIIMNMETLRIIKHDETHTDIEALIYGEWVVVKCILEDTMPKTDKFSLYEERGELLDIANELAIKELPFPLAPQLQEMNEQIRLIENITADNQRVYFSSGSAFEALDTIGAFQDGRNEVENKQIIAYFGRSNVTTSAEWRKRHLNQTQEQVDEAKANADTLKGLRS